VETVFVVPVEVGFQLFRSSGLLPVSARTGFAGVMLSVLLSAADAAYISGL